MTNEEIVALYEQGWSKKKIRRECNISLEKVDRAVRHIPGAINIPEEEKCLNIIKDYQEGMRYEAIRKKYSIHGSTLNNIFFVYNIEKVRKRKRNLNQNFFKTIDDEVSAYWLGFLFADGYNDENRGCIELGLSSKDLLHLNKFKETINSEHAISHRLINSSEAIRLNFCSRIMSSDLAKHGCVKAKSLILEFPTTVPEHLIHHFIRGYFDGDGSIVVNKEKRTYHAHLLGTINFLEKTREHCGLSNTKLLKKGNAYNLSYGGRLNMLKIFNYLYKDATIYLERKHEKFLLCQ